MEHCIEHSTAFRHASFWARVRMMSAVARERRRLGQLDDRMLTDLGITKHQAEAEASRHLWDLPPTRRR